MPCLSLGTRRFILAAAVPGPRPGQPGPQSHSARAKPLSQPLAVRPLSLRALAGFTEAQASSRQSHGLPRLRPAPCSRCTGRGPGRAAHQAGSQAGPPRWPLRLPVSGQAQGFRSSLTDRRLRHGTARSESEPRPEPLPRQPVNFHVPNRKCTL